MWLARYIVSRVAEQFGCDCDFEPKPVKGIFLIKVTGMGLDVILTFLLTKPGNKEV